jgi:hypothetical protein
MSNSTAWQKWKADGTLTPQSKGHYLVIDDDGEEVTLCGSSIPGLYDAEFEGGAYVDCKRCQKKVTD